MKPVYIIIGIPGSGKNTQAELLSAHLHIPRIDAGSTFANIITNRIEPYWSKIEHTYKSALPIPSEYFLEIMHDKFLENINQKGIVFTQHTKSVEELKSMLQIFKSLGFEVKKVFALNISKETAIERALKRLNGKFTDKEPDIETLIKRIDTFISIFPHITNFYQENNLLIEINGELSESQVFEKIIQSLNI